MIRRPPRSTRTDTLFPYTTLFRSTALITVHKDSSQHHAPPWQGGLPQMLIPRWTVRSCILRANAPALAAIVRDGERDTRARSDFHADIAAELDDIAEPAYTLDNVLSRPEPRSVGQGCVRTVS